MKLRVFLELAKVYPRILSAQMNNHSILLCAIRDVILMELGTKPEIREKENQ